MAGSPLEEPFRVSSIQRKYVRCGKRGCSGCPHGPYLYRTWREGRVVKREYIGPMPLPRLPMDGPAGGPDPEDRKRRPDEHPFAVGDRIRFHPEHIPCWVVVHGRKQNLRTDNPIMDVEDLGWAPFGQSGLIYPYVTLRHEGLAVHHPYDGGFMFADPERRLDRRFPVPLIVPDDGLPDPAP